MHVLLLSIFSILSLFSLQSQGASSVFLKYECAQAQGCLTGNCLPSSTKVKVDNVVLSLPFLVKLELNQLVDLDFGDRTVTFRPGFENSYLIIGEKPVSGIIQQTQSYFVGPKGTTAVEFYYEDKKISYHILPFFNSSFLSIGDLSFESGNKTVVLDEDGRTKKYRLDLTFNENDRILCKIEIRR